MDVLIVILVFAAFGFCFYYFANKPIKNICFDIRTPKEVEAYLLRCNEILHPYNCEFAKYAISSAKTQLREDYRQYLFLKESSTVHYRDKYYIDLFQERHQSFTYSAWASMFVLVKIVEYGGRLRVHDTGEDSLMYDLEKRLKAEIKAIREDGTVCPESFFQIIEDIPLD